MLIEMEMIEESENYDYFPSSPKRINMRWIIQHFHKPNISNLLSTQVSKNSRNATRLRGMTNIETISS